MNLDETTRWIPGDIIETWDRPWHRRQAFWPTHRRGCDSLILCSRRAFLCFEVECFYFFDELASQSLFRVRVPHRDPKDPEQKRPSLADIDGSLENTEVSGEECLRGFGVDSIGAGTPRSTADPTQWRLGTNGP